MRDKFVVGASSSGNTTYPGLSVDAEGGSKDAYLVSHTHGAGTYSAVSAGAHTHTYSSATQTNRVDNDETHQYLYSNTTQDTGSAGDHTHSLSGSSGSEGSGTGSGANLPPYYALCYIMKS